MSVDIDQFILDYKRSSLEGRRGPQRLPQINPVQDQLVQQQVVPIQYARQPARQSTKSYPSRLSTPEKPLVERLTEGEMRHKKFVEERKRDLQQELNSSRRQKPQQVYSQTAEERQSGILSSRFDEQTLQKQQEERNREYNQFIQMEAEKFRNRFIEKKSPRFSNELPLQVPRRLPRLLQSSEFVPSHSSNIQSVVSTPRLQITSRADELLRQVQNLRNSSFKSQLQPKYYLGSLPHISSLHPTFDAMDLKLSVPRTSRLVDISRGSGLRSLSELGSFRLAERSREWNEGQGDLLYKRNHSFPYSDRGMRASLNNDLLQSHIDKLAEFEQKLKELDLLFDQQKSTPRNPRSSSLDRYPIQRTENSLALVLRRDDDEESQRRQKDHYRRELEQQIKERHQMRALEMSSSRNDLMDNFRIETSRNRMTSNQFSPRHNRKDIFQLTQVDNNFPTNTQFDNSSKKDYNRLSVGGLIFSSDEDRKEEQRRQQEKFTKELSAQIEERKRERERQQREQEEYDKRKAEEMANYKPFGKEGGGAPPKNSARHIEEGEKKNEVLSPKHLVDVSLAKQSKSPEPAREQGHARGGHGIFGEPLTDTQKNVADQYKEELRKQIEEKKRREEMEREREIEAEKRELKRLHEEQRKIVLEKEEEEKKKREKEKALQQENDQQRESLANEKKLRNKGDENQLSSQNVASHGSQDESPSTRSSMNVQDKEDALQSLKIMKQKLDNELRRTAGSLLAMKLDADDYMVSNTRVQVKRPTKSIKEKSVIVPLSATELTSAGDTSEADRKSMDTTEAEIIVNDFIQKNSQTTLQPVNPRRKSVQKVSPRHERRTSEQSILLDSESAFLRLSQPMRQSFSGKVTRPTIPLEDWDSQVSLNELARKNEERRQRVQQMQEESQSLANSDPEKVLSLFLFRHKDSEKDTTEYDDQQRNTQNNPTREFASARDRLQSGGSLHSQLVNESEMHPIDSFNHEIFQSS